MCDTAERKTLQENREDIRQKRIQQLKTAAEEIFYDKCGNKVTFFQNWEI